MSDEAETGQFFRTMDDLPDNAHYTDMDKYRDFRRVFMDSEEGRRVLRCLLARGHMFKTSMPPGGQTDPLRLAFAEGERNIALHIITTINTEPAERPVTTNRKKGD